MTGGTTSAGPVDPLAVAAAVSGVPGVRLHAGAPVATHLPGRRVAGVRLTERPAGSGTEVAAEVHVTVAYPTTVAGAAEAVRGALAPFGLARVDVVVEDVVRPEDLDAPDAGSGTARPEDETGGSHG